MHPYAGPIQLLYAQKLKEIGDGAFSAQWEKTLLHFKNPLLLQHILAAPQVAVPFSVAISNENAPISKTRPDSGSPIKHNNTTGNVPEGVTDDTEEAPFKIMDIPGLKIEPVSPGKNVLSFTPYYTVDYFASQGIKLHDDAKPTDRFGRQLKTFTSWLKEMRRLPDAEVVSRFTSLDHNKVEQMASSSVSGENAITEAMAEVWMKQQNLPKAIEVYKKLSLQNPAKSAFFAAKIEFLKKQL